MVEDESKLPPAPFDFDASSLIQAVPGAVALVDETGVVVWVSDQCEVLSGFTPNDLVGTNILDYLDLESNPLALESVGYALENPGLRLPSIHGFRTATGAIVQVEAVANNQFATPGIGALVVHLRACDEEQLLHAMLSSVASGAPIDAVFKRLADLVAGPTLRSESTLIMHRGGAAAASMSMLSDPALAHAADIFDGPTPWEVAAALRRSVHLAELDTSTSPEGPGTEFEACWAYPIDHVERNRATAVLTIWRREAGLPEPNATLMVKQLVDLIQLTLDRSQQTRRLVHAAHHDHLTGLANRATFYDEVDARLAVDEADAAVLYLDLDGFKAVNDKFGHQCGDQVLQLVADRLVEVTPEQAVVGRLGGDEFGVFVERADQATIMELSRNLIDAIAAPMDVDDHQVNVGATIGVAINTISDDAASATSDELIDRADQILIEAKATAKGTPRLAS